MAILDPAIAMMAIVAPAVVIAVVVATVAMIAAVVATIVTPVVVAAIVASVAVAAILLAIAIARLRRGFGRYADAGHQQAGGEDLGEFHWARLSGPGGADGTGYEPPRVSFLNATVGQETGWRACAMGWYGTLQVAWFRRHLRESGARAFVDASIAMAECVAMLVVVTALFG